MFLISLISLFLALLALSQSSHGFSVTRTKTNAPTGTQLSSPSLYRLPFLYMSESLSKATEKTEDETPLPSVACPDCDRCDGSGRILGGIGIVAPWWPIKAYRPCPNFIDRGGVYQRSGQGLDEIAFGRDSSFEADR